MKRIVWVLGDNKNLVNYLVQQLLPLLAEIDFIVKEKSDRPNSLYVKNNCSNNIYVLTQPLSDIYYSNIEISTLKHCIFFYFGQDLDGLSTEFQNKPLTSICTSYSLAADEHINMNPNVINDENELINDPQTIYANLQNNYFIYPTYRFELFVNQNQKTSQMSPITCWTSKISRIQNANAFLKNIFNKHQNFKLFLPALNLAIFQIYFILSTSSVMAILKQPSAIFNFVDTSNYFNYSTLENSDDIVITPQGATIVKLNSHVENILQDLGITYYSSYSILLKLQTISSTNRYIHFQDPKDKREKIANVQSNFQFNFEPPNELQQILPNYNNEKPITQIQANHNQINPINIQINPEIQLQYQNEKINDILEKLWLLQLDFQNQEKSMSSTKSSPNMNVNQINHQLNFEMQSNQYKYNYRNLDSNQPFNNKDSRQFQSNENEKVDKKIPQNSVNDQQILFYDTQKNIDELAENKQLKADINTSYYGIPNNGGHCSLITAIQLIKSMKKWWITSHNIYSDNTFPSFLVQSIMLGKSQEKLLKFLIATIYQKLTENKGPYDADDCIFFIKALLQNFHVDQQWYTYQWKYILWCSECLNTNKSVNEKWRIIYLNTNTQITSLDELIQKEFVIEETVCCSCHRLCKKKNFQAILPAYLLVYVYGLNLNKIDLNIRVNGKIYSAVAITCFKSYHYYLYAKQDLNWLKIDDSIIKTVEYEDAINDLSRHLVLYERFDE